MRRLFNFAIVMGGALLVTALISYSAWGADDPAVRSAFFWLVGGSLPLLGWGALLAYGVARAERKAVEVASRALEERRAAVRRREEAIAHGGAPGQLSEPALDAPDGALSEAEPARAATPKRQAT